MAEFGGTPSCKYSFSNFSFKVRVAFLHPHHLACVYYHICVQVVLILACSRKQWQLVTLMHDEGGGFDAL